MFVISRSQMSHETNTVDGQVFKGHNERTDDIRVSQIAVSRTSQLCDRITC